MPQCRTYSEGTVVLFLGFLSLGTMLNDLHGTTIAGHENHSIVLASSIFSVDMLPPRLRFQSTLFPAFADPLKRSQLCTHDQKGVAPTELFRSVDVQVGMLG